MSTMIIMTTMVATMMMKMLLKMTMLMCDRVYLPLQAGTTIMSGAVSNVLEGGGGGQRRSMQYQDISLGDIKICDNEK